MITSCIKDDVYRSENNYLQGISYLIMHVFIFILINFKIHLFIGKSDMQRGGETERKIFHPMIHSPVERNCRCFADPVPSSRNYSGYPTQVQDPNALGCPPLLSQATSRELDGKWSWQD